MHLYVVAGLAVASEFPLPGLIDAEPGGVDGAAVRVRLTAVPDSLEGAEHFGPNWAMSGRQLLLAIPGVARFLLGDGRDVAVQPDPGRRPEEAAVFLTETVLGLLMHQRGRIVLRAGAVVAGSRAILLCGPSGAGKSTLAAALDGAGYPLLCDDLCAIDLGAGRPALACPDGGRLKLWAEAVEALGLGDRAARPMREGLEKYFVEPRGEPIGRPPPVAAVYLLREARRADSPTIEALSGMPAVRAVSDGAYRRPLVATMGQSALYFEGATVLARQAGTFILSRRFDLAQLSVAVEALKRHWEASGLTEDAA